MGKMRNVCATCQNTAAEGSDAMKRCARCRVTYYCSTKCQRQDRGNHKKLCSHDEPLPSAHSRAYPHDTEAAGSHAQPDAEAAGEDTQAGNSASAPLVPDARKKGKMARAALETATYDDVRGFSPREVAEWLESLGFFAHFDDSPRVPQALEESMLDGAALLELAATPRGLQPDLPSGPAAHLFTIVRELRRNHGRFLRVDTVNLC